VIYRLLNRKIDAFTAVSDHIKKVLTNLSIPDKKIHQVYNGIPIIAELPIKKLEALIKSEVLKFAIIGQVAEWKGHSTLLAAVENLIGKGKNNFIIAVYGNDNNPFADRLKNQIEVRNLGRWFEWKGFVNNQDAIYNECAVVIVPSLSEEPCSLTIIEAMSMAKGLIVSDRAAILNW
jgi:glycosyltransferase involved in cell wall biosynthesis